MLTRDFIQARACEVFCLPCGPWPWRVSAVWKQSRAVGRGAERKAAAEPLAHHPNRLPPRAALPPSPALRQFPRPVPLFDVLLQGAGGHEVAAEEGVHGPADDGDFGERAVGDQVE